MTNCSQTDIGVSSFQRLLNQKPDSIPNVLKIIYDGVREYNQKLRDNEKFPQEFGSRWMSIDRKSIWTVCVINESYVYCFP